MSSLFQIFSPPSRAGAAWFHVGPVASLPDITSSGASRLGDRVSVTQPPICDDSTDVNVAVPKVKLPGCKVYQVPRQDASRASEVELQAGVDLDAEAEDTGATWAERLVDQVMVFRYKGKVHAVDHKCPHASFPLSEAVPFDIEDFGVVLSAGLECPKHGWSFDMFHGNSDRGGYKLAIWEVQLRKPGGGSVEPGEQEVWVRRKQRIG